MTTLILVGLAVAFPFRCGLFNIGGQGQYLVGLIVANWVGVSLRKLADAAARPARGRRSGARRRGLGRHRRHPEGDDRRARGDHDDHAQLDRASGEGSTCSARVDRCRTHTTRRRRSRGRSCRARAFRSSGATRCCRGSTTASSSPRGPRRLLADPEPDDARLRGAGDGLQSRCSRLRRHQREEEVLSSAMAIGGRVRRASPARSTCSVTCSSSASSTSQVVAGRIPRDRRCAARPEHRGRGRPRGVPLRRPALRDDAAA